MVTLNEALEVAYNKGYRATKDGRVIAPSGKLRKLWAGRKGYLGFSVSCDKYIRFVYVHRLQAYQSFGNKIFDVNITVRHLDGDSLNNSEDNIAIGSQSDNMMDILPSNRIKHALKAAKIQRKLLEEEVKQLRLDRIDGMKYDELIEKYGISKSTVSYIVNNKTYKM